LWLKRGVTFMASAMARHNHMTSRKRRYQYLSGIGGASSENKALARLPSHQRRRINA